jgi:hypothetical protein
MSAARTVLFVARRFFLLRDASCCTTLLLARRFFLHDASSPSHFIAADPGEQAARAWR